MASTLPPLFAAAASGDADEIQRLLAQGAKVDAPLDAATLDEKTKYAVVEGRSGYEYAHYEVASALNLAIAAGQTAAAAALLDAGASVKALGKDVMSPLAVAVREKNMEIARRLLAGGASANGGYEATYLFEAASGGSEPMVRLLLDAGAEVDAEANEFQETALHGAVRSGNIAVVKLLLERGADPSASSEDGTPADVAREEGFEKIAVFLEQAG